jgi:cell division protein FtsB
MAAATQRKRRARSQPGRTVRWDRVGRMALLGTLGVILLLYISPAKHWIEQSGTASAEKAELRELESEHARLARRVKELRDPQAVEREARRLGMVRQGERAYVIENAPR